MRLFRGQATQSLIYLAPLALWITALPARAQSDPPKARPDDATVATVGTKKITAGEMKKVLEDLPPEVRAKIPTNPKVALEFYFLAKHLASLGEESHLDQESPYKEQLEGRRLLTLANAQIAAYADELKITPDDRLRYYEANKEKYPKQAEVRVITLYFGSDPAADAQGKKPMTEGEAKALASRIHEQLAGGADFEKLQTQYSQDPTSNHGLIRPDDKLNDSLKSLIFSMKPGQISEPVEQANAFYIVRLDQIGPPTLAQVSEEMTPQVKQVKVNEYIKELQRRFMPTIDDPATGAATVDGKHLSAAEVKTMLDSLTPDKQMNAKKDLSGFLQEYFLVHHLAALAVEKHLDQKSPFREQLAHLRVELLYNAALNYHGNLIQVQSLEQEQYYREHALQYTQTAMRAMMVFFSKSPGSVSAGGHKLLSEEEAKTLAEKIRAQIHEPADFDKLHDQYPNDTTTESVALRHNSRQFAEEVKARIFALHPGEVSEPIRQNNVFYIVRSDKVEPIPYVEVRDEIFQQIKQQRFNEWVASLRKQFQVTIEDPGFFQLAAR
jgi:parvulin-like peptidyl-prolyl isomerase